MLERIKLLINNLKSFDKIRQQSNSHGSRISRRRRRLLIQGYVRIIAPYGRGSDGVQLDPPLTCFDSVTFFHYRKHRNQWENQKEHHLI